MKIIKYIVYGLIIFSSMIFIYIWAVILRPSPAELSTVSNLTVTEEKDTDNTYKLTIKGDVVSSAQFVDSIKVYHRNNELNIVVYMKLIDKKNIKASSFDYRLSVPENVSLVTFGKNKQIIWSR